MANKEPMAIALHSQKDYVGFCEHNGLIYWRSGMIGTLKRQAKDVAQALTEGVVRMERVPKEQVKELSFCKICVMGVEETK